MVRSVERSSVASACSEAITSSARAEMDVERRDQVVAPTARRRRWPVAAARCAQARQPDLGKPHRLLAVVGDEDRARGEDARRAPLGQRLEIGVDHRVLDIGERRLRRLGGARLGARQHQAVAGRAGASRRPRPRRSPARCGRPARARRIERVAARQRPPGQAVRSSVEIAGRTELWRSVASRPKAVKAVRLPPGPTPSSRRPSLSRSSTDRVLGDTHRQLERQGDDAGAEPDARGLRAATCARKTKGAGRPPSASWK